MEQVRSLEGQTTFPSFDIVRGWKVFHYRMRARLKASPE